MVDISSPPKLPFITQTWSKWCFHRTRPYIHSPLRRTSYSHLDTFCCWAHCAQPNLHGDWRHSGGAPKARKPHNSAHQAAPAPLGRSVSLALLASTLSCRSLIVNFNRQAPAAETGYCCASVHPALVGTTASAATPLARVCGFCFKLIKSILTSLSSPEPHTHTHTLSLFSLCFYIQKSKGAGYLLAAETDQRYPSLPAYTACHSAIYIQTAYLQGYLLTLQQGPPLLSGPLDSYFRGNPPPCNCRALHQPALRLRVLRTVEGTTGETRKKQGTDGQGPKLSA